MRQPHIGGGGETKPIHHINERRCSIPIDTYTLETAYFILKQGGKLPDIIYWELVAEGLYPEQLSQLILEGVTLRELCRSREDCLDSPDRLDKEAFKAKLEQMGQDELDIHPQAFKIQILMQAIS